MFNVDFIRSIRQTQRGVKGRLATMDTSPEAEAIQVPNTPNLLRGNQDAREKLHDFNWDDLETRFHKDMDKCNEEEKKLYDELEGLMSVS